MTIPCVIHVSSHLKPHGKYPLRQTSHKVFLISPILAQGERWDALARWVVAALAWDEEMDGNMRISQNKCLSLCNQTIEDYGNERRH